MKIKYRIWELIILLFGGISLIIGLIIIFLFFFALSKIDWFDVMPFAFLFLPEIEGISLSKLRELIRKKRGK